MRILLQVFRFFVGALFIFSGTVKLIDPVGTQIKMEEYFEVFAQAFHPVFEDLIPFALPIALLMCIAEVVMGVALLLYYRMRVNMWIFLLLMIFFTFLTGYTALALYSKENPDTSFAISFAQFAGVDGPANINSVSDCGCFGDFIKLKPWESFMKDVILMIPTLFLFWYRRRLESEFNETANVAIMVIALVASSTLGWYAVAHLPPVDFRPYKVGADIKANMQPAEPLRFVYTMEKNGEKKVFTEYPTDTTWHYVAMDIANPEAKPKITDYNLDSEEGNYTQQSLVGNKLFVIIRFADKTDPAELKKVVSLVNNLSKLTSNKIECAVLTGSGAEAMEALRHEAQLGIPYYFVDVTVLKTIMRPNVGLWLLKDGVVKGKWHVNDVPDLHEVIEKVK